MNYLLYAIIVVLILICVYWYRTSRQLFRAIEKHHDQEKDDRCWLDDNELYATAGLGPANVELPPKEKFLENCSNYYNKRCANGEWPSYQEIAARLKLLESVCTFQRGHLRALLDSQHALYNRSPILDFEVWIAGYIAIHKILTPSEYGAAKAGYFAAHLGNRPITQPLTIANLEQV